MTEPQAPKKATPAASSAGNAQPRESYAYVGYRDPNTWELFSDELEASRYALDGSTDRRVEKRVLGKRSK